jgi:hypothetical protein
MNTDLPLRSLSPHPLLMEQAKREALRLRREAIAAFWADVAQGVRNAPRRLRSIVSQRKAVPCPR